MDSSHSTSRRCLPDTAAFAATYIVSVCIIARSARYALLACPRFENKREPFRASWEGPLTPEGIKRCMLASQEGWDAVVTLTTSIVESLNSFRRAEEKRGVALTRASEATTATVK